MHLRLPALFVLVLALLLVSLPAQADSNPNPGILPPNQPAYGKSYGEWAAAWWNWALSGPDGNNVLQLDFCSEIAITIRTLTAE